MSASVILLIDEYQHSQSLTACESWQSKRPVRVAPGSVTWCVMIGMIDAMKDDGNAG